MARRLPSKQIVIQAAAMKIARQFGEEDVAQWLKERGQISEFIDAIERQDRKQVAKLIREVAGPDDGTFADLYLALPNLLQKLRGHL